MNEPQPIEYATAYQAQKSLTSWELEYTLTEDSGSVSSVAFSPNGCTLASGSEDRTIKLWDVATQEEIATLKGHSDSVYSVAFSPNGRTLASGSRDSTIKLWDVATQEEIATLKGHSAWVYSVAFSPDGRTLASGSWDTIKIWQRHLSDNNDGDEEDDEKPPVLSPEERRRIKEENINDLHITVDQNPELSKLKNASDDDAWESLTEWIAESTCDINFRAASKSVKRLTKRVRHKTPHEIAHKLIIDKSLQAAGLELIGDMVATVNNILEGLGAKGIDLPEIAKLAAEMIYQIAEIYGFNIDAPERKQEALFIFGFIFSGEKVIDIGIDWLKLGYLENKLLKVGTKALMIYGTGHAACFYYEYKDKFEFSLIPPDDLLNKLSQERDNYFPDDVSEATVKQKLIVEISIDSYNDPDPKVRINAISQALNYGDDGVNLLLQALTTDESTDVKDAAYNLLYSKYGKLIESVIAYQAEKSLT
jgi:hypothetical protein